MRPAASIRRVAAALLASAVASAAALAAGTAAAATLKATLLLPQDDPRLERSRLERGYLGHPGGPAGDGLQVALDEGRFELDALGAEIALAAGYDPIRGANFFTRLPDPGYRFMGSHPANAERLAVVRATVKRLAGG